MQPLAHRFPTHQISSINKELNLVSTFGVRYRGDYRLGRFISIAPIDIIGEISGGSKTL